MASRVYGQGEGVVVREVIALALEIAGKSQIAVQGQEEAVNASTLERPFCAFLVGPGIFIM